MGDGINAVEEQVNIVLSMETNLHFSNKGHNFSFIKKILKIQHSVKLRSLMLFALFF